MAELLIRGTGRPPQCRDEVLAAQAAWVAHRRRKVAAQAMLADQIHGQLDLIFPGLTGCFSHGLDAASLRVLIRDLPDPDRVRRLGRGRGVALRAPPWCADDPAQGRAGRGGSSGGAAVARHRTPYAAGRAGADWALFEALDHQIHDATAALTDLLPKTPAGILLGVPGVGVLSASAYGAAIGDPHRYRDAAAAYHASGLVPISYESAGRSRTRTGISREGSVEWQRAIVDLGRGVGLHHPDFITYRRQLTARGKPPLVALIAVGHRAHRLAFAMLRSQRPFGADRWERAVTGRRHRHSVAVGVVFKRYGLGWAVILKASMPTFVTKNNWWWRLVVASGRRFDGHAAGFVFGSGGGVFGRYATAEPLSLAGSIR